MARKKQEEAPPPGSPAWMATYGDMMTLVLCFFVLLFSMSTIEADKFQQVALGMQSSFNIQVGGSSPSAQKIGELMGAGVAQLPHEGTGIQSNELEDIISSQEQIRQMASDFKTYFAQEQSAGQIEIEEMVDGVKLRFKDNILFDLGKADLKPEAIPILEKVAEQLNKYQDNDIKVEGHTDNLPINTAQFPSNWELSGARAISVMRFFVDNRGFPAERFSNEGFGEHKPVADNDTDEGRAKNRRVEIKIMGSSYSEYNSEVPLQ